MMSYINDSLLESINTQRLVLEDQHLLNSIKEVALACIQAFQRGNRVILAGNGGSAADAQHIAAEFVSRFIFDRPALPALALTTDTSMLTSIANDYGYERLFERQLEANGRKGDVFIGITTSGNSSNVLFAIDRCRHLGIVSVGLAGAGGLIQDRCDHIIAVPSTSTPRIQESHITIGHIICGLVENAMFKRAAA